MAKKRKKPRRGKRSVSQQIDTELAISALWKRQRNESPTRDELAALRRYEARVDAESREGHYQAVPKKWWVDASGRDTKTLHRLADKHDIPLRGRTIDLAEIVSWLHGFIDEHGDTRGKDGEQTAPELEKLRATQREKIEMELAIRRGEYRHRDDVRRTFEFIANVFRRATTALRAEFGDGAYEILKEAVDDAYKVLDKFEARQKEGTEQ